MSEQPTLFPHDWQNRVVAEKAEHDQRLHKLQQFLGNPAKTHDLSDHDLTLLAEQEHHMRMLSRVLGMRIARFGLNA